MTARESPRRRPERVLVGPFLTRGQAAEYARAFPHEILHRPDLLPAVVVFLVGLMQDALDGEPFGVPAFVLIAVYWLVVSQQRHFRGRPFLVVWSGFAAAALMADILRWILVSLVLGVALAPWAIMLEYFMTVMFYPVLTVAFALAHKTLPRGEAGDFVD